MALSMLAIATLVGARELGQETFTAFLVGAEGRLPVVEGANQIGWLDRSAALATLAARV